MSAGAEVRTRATGAPMALMMGVLTSDGRGYWQTRLLVASGAEVERLDFAAASGGELLVAICP